MPLRACERTSRCLHRGTHQQRSARPLERLILTGKEAAGRTSCLQGAMYGPRGRTREIVTEAQNRVKPGDLAPLQRPIMSVMFNSSPSGFCEEVAVGAPSGGDRQAVSMGLEDVSAYRRGEIIPRGLPGEES